jgi:adenylate cyclase
MIPASKSQPIRKLATILNADVVGFSRLMGADEEETLRTLKEREQLIHQLVLEHHGRSFGTAGDSFMIEFASPVEAVRCAVACQESLGKINADQPLNRRFLLRIGVNLGDVMLDGENLYGDGVNIAARLQSLADPGGICISQSVYELVRHRLTVGFEDIGKQSMKNIMEPVQAYRVVVRERPKAIRLWQKYRKPLQALALPVTVAFLAALAVWFWQRPTAVDMAQTALDSGEPSIAVLPLTNLSGDPSQEYFSDGLTNDITTDLSKFSGLLVIASNSAFTFKGRRAKVQDIGQDLGVRYLLEGTVQKNSSQLRINAQLIDTATGHHVWAQRYERKADEVLTVQDEIIQKIVTALAVNITAAEQQRANREETNNMDAYDYYLRGKAVVADPSKITPQGNTEARSLFEKAIELDPMFSEAYGELSYLFVREYQNGWSTDPNASLKKAEDLAKRSLAIADNAESRWSLAIVYWNQGAFEKSLAEYGVARDLNPNDSDLAADMAEALVYGGEPERAIKQIKEAIAQNPKTPYWYFWNLGRAYYMAGHYQEALDAIAKINDPPNDVLLITAAAKAQLGDMEGARSDIAEFSRNDPDWSVAKSAAYYYRNDADRQHWVKGLRKAGLKEM